MQVSAVGAAYRSGTRSDGSQYSFTEVWVSVPDGSIARTIVRGEHMVGDVFDVELRTDREGRLTVSLVPYR